MQLRLNSIIIIRVAESESPESHVLEGSWSTFFRFDEVGIANRSRFFRFGEVGNRIPYCIWRHLFTLNYFTFLHFISIFIFLSQECDGGAVHR